MNCPQCQTNIVDPEAKFCPHCATDLVKHRVELQRALLKKANETQPDPEPEINDVKDDVALSEAGDTKEDDAVTFKFAGFWIRALAMLIDVILLQALYFITLSPFVIVIGILAANMPPLLAMQIGIAFVSVLAILLQWMWFTIGDSSVWQATPGKKILGLKVVDINGEKIGFGKANLRYWSRIISTLPAFMGYLMTGMNAKKQSLHDKIAKTIVIKA